MKFEFFNNLLANLSAIIGNKAKRTTPTQARAIMMG
jgi:hypothetical protein